MVEKDKSGFTLAEVLITLLIIGVVSSIVIPAILHDTQMAEFHTAWKKEYGILSQTTKQLIADQELPGTSTTSLMNNFGNHLSYAKKCTGSDNSCWHLDNQWQSFSNTPIPWGLACTSFWTFSNPAYILNDGSLMAWYEYNGGRCDGNNGAAGIRCIVIFIDVNGFKKPNRVGYDIYSATLFDNKIVPNGSSYTDYTSCSSTNFTTGWSGIGSGCSSKVITGQSY